MANSSPFAIGLPDPATFQPTSSAQKRLEEIKSRLGKTRELTKLYNQRYNQLVDFTKVITDGYINNINVIVDIGSLLNMYNGVFDKMMEVLMAFDQDLKDEIKPESIAHIKALTNENLIKVNEFFQKDVKGVIAVMDKIGNSQMKTNLEDAITKYAKTKTSAENTIKSFVARGGSKNLKSYKPYRIKVQVNGGASRTDNGVHVLRKVN